VKEIHQDGWKIEARVGIESGVPVLRNLSIEPLGTAPLGGVTGEVLRDVHTGEIISEATEVYKEWAARRPGFRTGFDPRQAVRRPGRRGHPPEFWLEVAVVYAQAQKHHTRAVAERFDVKPTTASQMIFEVRRRGLLTGPPGPGRPGGELTLMAIAQLKALNNKEAN